MKYSVLMSVYYKENSQHFEEALLSVIEQSVKTDDLVLVCDGPLTNELNIVIDNMKVKFGSLINVVRLAENVGLGEALRIGLQHCLNDYVMRADSDDICFENRAKKQLELFKKNPNLDIIGGEIVEFQQENKLLGVRKIPEFQQDIIKFSKIRNPFNHPTVMFKKEVVIDVGNYSERFNLFEDYYLWVRLLKSGYQGYNLQEPLIKMRVSPDLYSRRGGVKYAKELLKFKFWLKKVGWISWKQIFFVVFPHVIVCILPNKIRKSIYQLLRN